MTYETKALSPATVASLEKIPSAARRMGMSISQFYRVAKRDGLQIVKISERSSAAVSSEIDLWIAGRIAASAGKRGAA